MSIWGINLSKKIYNKFDRRVRKFTLQYSAEFCRLALLQINLPSTETHNLKNSTYLLRFLGLLKTNDTF